MYAHTQRYHIVPYTAPRMYDRLICDLLSYAPHLQVQLMQSLHQVGGQYIKLTPPGCSTCGGLRQPAARGTGRRSFCLSVLHSGELDGEQGVFPL